MRKRVSRLADKMNLDRKTKMLAYSMALRSEPHSDWCRMSRLIKILNGVMIIYEIKIHSRSV